jgi:hypothetical protein
MDRQIAEIRSLATKHSKEELGRMVNMGLLDPQKAMLAGMMIDRIQKQNAKPPQSTVAEDVLGLPGMAQKAQAQQMQQPEAAGVEALPAGNVGEYAGGGIVAFAHGGDIPGYADGELVSAADVFRRGLATQPNGIMDAPGAPVIPAAPVPAIQNPTYLPDNIDFEKGAVPVYRAKLPEKIDLTKAAQLRQEAETLAGANPNFYEDLRRDVLADKEDFAKQKNEAKGMAMLQAGLGLMGARKGQEFQALSAAGQQAVASYGSALKDIKASEKEMKKSLRDLTVAQETYRRSNAEKDLAKVQASEDKLQASEQDYAKALNDGVGRKVDLFKTNKQAETQIRSAEIGKEGVLGAAAIRAREERLNREAPSAQIKLIERLQSDPTFKKTYEEMQATLGKQEADQRTQLSLLQEWERMGVVGKNALADQGITTAEDYIRTRMATLKGAGGAGRGGAGAGGGTGSAGSTGGVFVQTPQGAVRFNTQAEADAFKQKFGLK